MRLVVMLVGGVVWGQVTVPFVGCKSDGQVGPLAAPKGAPVAVRMGAQEAAQLAYYVTEHGPGVLAPRGWNCFGTYGSGGASTYVGVQPLDWDSISGGITGYIVNASLTYGGTSGRFGVATIIARVFPARMDFVDEVRELEPTAKYPRGPFPGDRVDYRGKNVVVFRTAAGVAGLGTWARLAPNDQPIDGVAVLVENDPPDVLILSMRLPDRFAGLVAPIIRQFERDATKAKAR